MTVPRASIVIAMHNAATTVAQTIRWLQSQTESSWEAIVVDDGSTDGCGEIVASFADPRITLIRQPNAGPGAARNSGLDRCRGDFVGFLDADDWLEPDALEVLLTLAHTGRHDAVCGRCALCDQDCRPIDWALQSSDPTSIGLRELLTREAFAIHAQLIRRSAIGTTRFRTNLNCYEDADFFLRLAEEGLHWRCTDRVVCTYRQRPRDRGTPEFADRFRTIKTVFADSFHRIRRLEAAPQGIDASNVALDQLLFDRAFTYATMMILQDSTPTKDVAASVLSMIEPSHRITPEQAARAAHGYLPWSESRAVSEWPRHIERYASELNAWWQRCISDGRAESGLAERARPLLARLIANELDIPDHLLRHVDPVRPITLLGAGRNGIRLARTLASRGMVFGVREDREERRAEVVHTSGGCARIIDARAPYESHTQHIMTVLDDAAYLKRLPPAIRCIRWADQVEAAARNICNQLLDSTHQPGDAAWAHAHTR